MENIIKEKDETISDLKKNVKTTQLNELKLLLNLAEKECKRLRRMLDESMTLKQDGNAASTNEKFIEQSILIKDLTTKNEELNAKLEKKSEELNNAQENFKDEDSKKSETNLKQKRTLNEYKDKITALTSEIEELNRGKDDMEKSNKNNLDNIKKKYEVELANKNKTIEELMANLKNLEELNKDSNKAKMEICIHFIIILSGSKL